MEKPDDKVIDRIKKLLEHHQGSLKINSEQEAITALELAKNLMRKYHLDMMSIQEHSGISENDIVQRKIDKCSVYTLPIWMTNLINTVNNLCNCSCVLQKEPQSNGYIHINVVFVADKNDIEKAVELYTFFKKTTYRLANLHVKRVCGNYTNWRSFAEGFTSRLLERSREYFKEINGTEETDVHDMESVDDSDFVESENDEVELNTKNTQLSRYLRDIREKIDEFIKKNINNVKSEQIKSSSKVIACSYNSGRKQAENTQLRLIDKSHQLT